jgi:hypothetical protein
VELQRYMVFEGKPGSTAWAVLGEARDVLQRARATIHEKAEVGGRGPGRGGRVALVPLLGARRRWWGSCARAPATCLPHLAKGDPPHAPAFPCPCP